MNFKEYYQHYLSLHRNPWCRRLHVLGQLATVTFIISVTLLAVNVSLWFLPLLIFAPFVVYGFAWPGHFFFEKNKPAAFRNPVWAKACDWLMLFDILRGRIPL